MQISAAGLIAGSLGIGALGVLVGLFALPDRNSTPQQGSTVVLMAPAPDNKTELAYRRNGFGDRIMTPQRRAALSQCYQDFLKRSGIDESKTPPAEKDLSKFEGRVTYVFQVGENGEKLGHEIVESQIEDTAFLSCLEISLRGVRFLPPPLGINRYLAHEFTFKSEQTFKRELEERKNQEPLVLVTVTPQK